MEQKIRPVGNICLNHVELVGDVVIICQELLPLLVQAGQLVLCRIQSRLAL